MHLTEDNNMSAFDFDVFISYARTDIKIARIIVDRLRDCGFRVWFAEEQLVPGTRFRAALEQGLRESCHLVAILTESYSQRSWTQREIDLFDLTADRTERRILAVQITALEQGPIDQVFLVHQRIQWNGLDFDPEGFWLLYCGLNNQRPGPSKEWGAKTLGLFNQQTSSQLDKTARYKKLSKVLYSPPESIYKIPEIDSLINHCLFDPTPTWEESFLELKDKLKLLAVDTVCDAAILQPWAIGRAERASVVSLALLPQVLRNASAWAFIDIACQDIARWFLIAFSLKNSAASEVWFSWVIAEQAWPFLQAAADQVPNEHIRKHLSYIADVALRPQSSFKEAESNYDYGVMITPWNHFHLCWLAIKLGDLTSAALHAKALCDVIVRGDFRAGRFLTRLSHWSCFHPLIDNGEIDDHINSAREALKLESLETMVIMKQRIEEIWRHAMINMGAA
ncbi:MAG: toll/interleukin-1 receptor domain-containing protein [Pyrinomonadaceae bacterium]